MWTGPTFQVYYSRIEELTRNLIDKEDSDYLLRVNVDEYLDHLVQELEWLPLEWFEAQKTIESFVVKRDRLDHRGRTYQVEEQRFRLRIPVSAHPQIDDYFKFGPSTTWAGSAEPPWKVSNGVLIHEVEASEQAVETGLEAVRFWLGNRNKDIEAGNSELPGRVRSVWEAKRRQLEDQYGKTDEVLKKLDIPLYQDPNASAKPVEIKPQQVRTVLAKPKATDEPVPSLRREDVVELVDFIDRYARQFEVAPETYQRLREDELRNLLVGMMNANYPGSTTGETFNKLGKTDISLRVDSGHALICECKFWSGATAYTAALEQLFGYLTWRQNYGILVHFCKLKDMTRAVAQAEKTTGGHPSCVAGSVARLSQTRFTSRHTHPQDADNRLEISHLFIDLSV